jgi:di- and tripeptidase
VARAKISVRTVPHQNPEKLIELIRTHLKHEFGKRRSPNELFIDVKKVCESTCCVLPLPDTPTPRLARLTHDDFFAGAGARSVRCTVDQVGDWWLGSQDADAFQMAEAAITDVWGVQPRHVREGGTMPITAFLETLLKAPAIHLPLGQATDNAHLPNERIRYLNLINGKEVIKRILRQVRVGHVQSCVVNAYTHR